MEALIIDISGWAGAVILLTAYAALSWGRLTSGSYSYQALNIVGSALLLLNAGFHGALPSAAVNAVWISIGGLAIWRIRASAVRLLGPEHSGSLGSIAADGKKIRQPNQEGRRESEH